MTRGLAPDCLPCNAIGLVDFTASLASNVCFCYNHKNGNTSAAHHNRWVSAKNHLSSLLFPIVRVALTGLFRH